jgi:hypothetical protein
VVQIVELDIGRISGLKHFHLHEGRDRLDMVGRQPVEKPEHQLPPGPELSDGLGPRARSGLPWRAETHGCGNWRGGQQDSDSLTFRWLPGFTDPMVPSK